MRYLLSLVILLLVSLTVTAQNVEKSESLQPETFEVQQGDSTVVMQKYFLVFLKEGPNRDQDKEQAMKIQEQHLAHLRKMGEEGKISLAGPMGNEGEIRGIVVYNTATMEEAKRLAEEDPAVKAGRLIVEVLPWWSQKGAKLQ